METCSVRTDPIEREPLHHFHPGTRVLRPSQLPSDVGALVAAAVREGARSVTVPARMPRMHELARLAGLRGVRVVSSCLAPELSQLYPTLRWVDAVVVRLVSLDAPGTTRMLDETARLVADGVWVELVCSVCPETCADQAIDSFASALADTLGHEIPLHLWAVRDDEACREQVRHERWIAQANGLHWVYGGDPTDLRARSSWCPGCDGLLAERTPGGTGPLLDEACPSCGWEIPGRFPRKARRRSSHTMPGVVPLRRIARTGT